MAKQLCVICHVVCAQVTAEAAFPILWHSWLAGCVAARASAIFSFSPAPPPPLALFLGSYSRCEAPWEVVIPRDYN